MLLRDLGRLTPSSSSLSSSTSSSVFLAPPRSFGGSSDPSEGLADAAEDLLRALRAEPDGGGTRSGGGGGGGRAARRADELAADGMWPLYRALGDVADLLDLADRGGGGGSGSDEFGGEESSSSSSSSADADADALSLLRSQPSLLLLPRSELARRLVLLKAAAGPGADAAALARKLPWLLSHADPGEVLRRTLQQMLELMPGVGGAAELRARLFGSGGGGRKRRSSDGRASQSWLTFADIARGVSRKLKVEEREREKEREEMEGRR